jgi:serine protease Do
MLKKKFKAILGFLSVLVFVSIVYLLSIGASQASLGFRSLPSKVSKFVSSLFGKPTFVTTTDVVQEESSVIDVVKKVSPAVVSVIAKTSTINFFGGGLSTQESGIGTGFIVEPNGIIVTNSHVIDDPNAQYSVVLKDGTVYPVSSIHLDETSDVAVIEIAARNLPTVSLGDSGVLQVGQRAIAIGNALGQFQNSVTVGVVSGIGRQISASAGPGTLTKVYDSVIQTDAALNPGNSGGPLLNSAGQVIGINVATTPGASNISFAIPINSIKPILDGFLKTGRIIKPYIGVYYTTITKEISQLQQLPQGAYVSRVITDSPADKAGLKRGDIITKVDDTALSDPATLASAIAQKNVGDTVTLTVDSNGKVSTVKVTLAEAPQQQPQPAQ